MVGYECAAEIYGKSMLHACVELHNWWSSVIFGLQFLAFVAYLNANYVPTQENAITYSMTLIAFLLLNAFASAIEGAMISAVIYFVEGLFK